jgi:hypothetical protein
MKAAVNADLDKESWRESTCFASERRVIMVRRIIGRSAEASTTNVGAKPTIDTPLLSWRKSEWVKGRSAGQRNTPADEPSVRISLRQLRLSPRSMPDGENLHRFLLFVHAIENPITSADDFSCSLGTIAFINGTDTQKPSPASRST